LLKDTVAAAMIGAWSVLHTAPAQTLNLRYAQAYSVAAVVLIIFVS